MTMNARRLLLTITLLAGCAPLLLPRAAQAQNTYTDTILVANHPIFEPLVLVDELLVNGWGLAIRPPGAGGHFWISNQGSGTTTVYVGDVHTPQGFVPLFQDDLLFVDIPAGGATWPDGTMRSPVSQPTGQVFNHSSTDFVVSGEGITAASKFIFVQADGTIAGWTEVRDPALRRQTSAVITVDNSSLYDSNDGLLYTGVAVTDFPSNNRLYVTNTLLNRVEVYNHLWQRVDLPAGRFVYPGMPEFYRPWNIQYFRNGPGGEGRLWVAYMHPDSDWEERPEFGAVAQFDLEGNFISKLTTSNEADPQAESEIKAPWGLAFAPSNFGPLSGALLVANFGDGSIAAYNAQSGAFIDYLRDAQGEVLIVDGIWGILFGNGVALGDSNALYYAAGPNFEWDGTFGSVRWTPDTCPQIRTGPTSARVREGGEATFVLDAPAPTRVTITWELQVGDAWVTLTDGPRAGLGEISGSASRELRVVGVQGPAALRATIANACGSATSEPAQLDLQCLADWDANGEVEPVDIQAFFNAYRAGDADADGNGETEPVDITTFFVAYRGGC
jgi:uncharacterized protein (TIGR03118 family)